MYSKEQASSIKQGFWTAFGKYMALSPSAEGGKVNWINYKTGIKQLHFKMQADHHAAYIEIEMTHPDVEIQELMLQQFQAFHKILNEHLNEEWEWELQVLNENYKTVSRIRKSLPGVSILKQEDWPQLISFFKPRILALDEFWSSAQYSFDVFK